MRTVGILVLVCLILTGCSKRVDHSSLEVTKSDKAVFKISFKQPKKKDEKGTTYFIGTGFHIKSGDEYAIVTAKHVVGEAKVPKLKLSDYCDVAVIILDKEPKYYYIPFEAKKSDKLTMTGFPSGKFVEIDTTIKDIIKVSDGGKEYKEYTLNGNHKDLSGISGGPLVLTSGKKVAGMIPGAITLSSGSFVTSIPIKEIIALINK